MKKLIRVLIVPVAVFVAAPQALCQEVIGEITYLQGRVERLKPGETTYLPVVIGEEISPQDTIRTKSYARAQVTFADGSDVRLAQNTQIQVLNYEIRPNGRRERSLIHLDRGRIRTIVSKTPDLAPFDIHTPNTAGQVRGSDLFVSYEKSATGILVMEGLFRAGHLNYPDQTIEIPNGRTSFVPYNAPPDTPRVFLPGEKEQLADQTRVAVIPVSESGEGSFVKAVVAQMTGEVDVQFQGQSEWRGASQGTALHEGDHIRTGEIGSVQLSMDNGHTIDLEPNTQLTIQSLKRDPKTGLYDNHFECKYGKVKAILQKFRGESSFTIGTPTAVAAARGTILYLIVLPQLTTSFFEGGAGTLTSKITSVMQVIGDGMMSSADAQGNVLDPQAVTDDVRQAFGSQFGSESNRYGYSAPGTPQGGTLPPPPPGTLAPAPAPEIEDGNNSDVPFNESQPAAVPSGPPPPPTNTPILASIGGNFGSFGSFDEDLSSSVEANLAAITSLPPWSSISLSELTGVFANPNDRDLWWGELEGDGEEGGALIGWMGGSWHSWDGVVSSLFIDSAGIAGTVLGVLSGETDDAAGTFTGSGDLFFIPVAAVDILPADIAGSLVTGQSEGEAAGSFGSGGHWNADFDEEFLSLEGQSWGVTRSIYQGTYGNHDLAANWIGHEAGFWDDTDALFYGIIEGIDDLEGAFRMDRVGLFLGFDVMGSYAGSVLGVYGPADEGGHADFEAYGGGIYEVLPLTFSGLWGEDSLYYNDDGDLEHGGEDLALMGSVASPWDGPASVLVIGFYSNAGEDAFGIPAYFWNTPISSFNGVEDKATTIDGGAFIGFTGGLWNNGVLGGNAAAIYMDPAGNAGLLTGDLAGSYFADYVGGGGEEGFFSLSGTFSPDRLALSQDLSIDPALLGNYLYAGGLEAYVAGSFGEGSGYLYGESDFGTTLFIYDDESGTGLPWGIYDVKIEGEDEFYNPEGSADWNAAVGGEGVFDAGDEGGYEGIWLAFAQGTAADGTLTGDLTGRYLTPFQMGEITGDVYGLFELDGELPGSGTWIAESVGTYQGEAIAFTGFWGEDSLYYNKKGKLKNGGEEYGLIGAVNSPWNGPAAFLALGFYENKGEGGDSDIPAYIWNTEHYSYNALERNGTTLDGGAFYGYSGGIWNDKRMQGSLASIYIDPDGNAGLLRSPVRGFYQSFEGDGGSDDDYGMWQAEGLITARQMSDPDEDEIYDPANLDDLIDSEDLEAGVEGGFLGADGEGFLDFEGEGSLDAETKWGRTYYLEDEDYAAPWGIYSLRLEGPDTYEKPDNASLFFAALYGEGEFGPVDGEFIGFAGGIWVDGEIIGGLRGIYVGEGEGESYGTGLLSGDIFGLYDIAGDTWIAESVGVFEQHGITEDAVLFADDFAGWGQGFFDGGGLLTQVSVEGGSLDLSDQDWGIWIAAIGGAFADPTENFRLTIGGSDDGSDPWFGVVTGQWETGGRIFGSMNGWFFDENDGEPGEGDLIVSRISGDVFGTFELEGEPTTFQAIGVGEWVELADLESEIVGFDFDDISDFLSVPITEVFADMLTGAGGFDAGGVIQGTMDMSFFADVQGALAGIWAGLIQGSFEGPTGNAWTLNLSSDNAVATLTGTEWSDEEWQAILEGSLSDGTSFSGAAGGTYEGEGSGTFEGVGTGTWSNDPANPV